MFLKLIRLLLNYDDILLANSSKTTQIVRVMRGFYSVSPSHTIDQCHPHYPLEPLSLSLHIISSPLSIQWF